MRLRTALAVAAICASTSAAASQVTAKNAALATAHPLATRAGLAVLQRGGNAVDASVAVAFALAVVHPQAGNLGGGGFLTYYDAESRAVWTLDFTEVAPLAATRDMFAKDPKGARTGARGIGVPGTVAGLEAMHRRFGTLSWDELMAPAIALAADGFVADAALVADARRVKSERGIAAFDGVEAGQKLKQGELAQTLRRVADKGAAEIYRGSTAKKLVTSIRAAGGILGFRDLRDYAPVWRAPLKLVFGAYDIYTVPPPSGGGLVIAETLSILGGDDLAAAGFQTPKAIHLVVEAQRRAYIDRNKYIADPLTARIPYREILSQRRAEQWRSTIDLERVTPTASLTEPTVIVPEREHTTHFTIADAQGNVAAVTTTLGDDFGSGFMAAGFFLNNAMDNFTIAPAAPNRHGLIQGIVNTVEPSKRMASSLAPTIVLRGGKPYLALGSRGGPAIPTSILQVFLNVTVHGKALGEAVAAPRFHHQALPEDLMYERTRASAKTVEALNAMGHGVAAREAVGEVHALLFDNGRIIAVADPRGGGAAGGF